MPESNTSSKPPTLVKVVIPAKVANNIELLQKAVSTSITDIVNRYGHPTCCSGIDIHFLNEVDFLVNTQTLKPQAMSEAGA